MIIKPTLPKTMKEMTGAEINALFRKQRENKEKVKLAKEIEKAKKRIVIELKDSDLHYPRSMQVTNLSEIKFPDTFKVSNLSELKEINKAPTPGGDLNKTLENLTRRTFDVNIKGGLVTGGHGGGGILVFSDIGDGDKRALVNSRREVVVDTNGSTVNIGSTININLTDIISTGSTIIVTTLTNSNTEYLTGIPSNTKRFTIQTRDSEDIRFAFETGKVATPTDPYYTLKSGQNYFEDNLNLTGKTIYYGTGVSGVKVELITWQ